MNFKFNSSDFVVVLAQATPDKQLMPIRCLVANDEVGHFHSHLVELGYSVVSFESLSYALPVLEPVPDNLD